MRTFCFSDLVAVIYLFLPNYLALSWSRGPLAAALLPAAALWPLDATWRRSMTTGNPVDGAPAVAGPPSRTLSSRGPSPSCIVRSTAGWATALERWRGRRVRLHERRAQRAVQHARALNVRQLATNVARPAGDQASTVTSARSCRW